MTKSMPYTLEKHWISVESLESVVAKTLIATDLEIPLHLPLYYLHLSVYFLTVGHCSHLYFCHLCLSFWHKIYLIKWKRQKIGGKFKL